MMDLLGKAVTVIFLIVVLSYYVLIFLPGKKGEGKVAKSITVIIPARNEERFIRECILSIKEARFRGKKEIIVVDDGSTDNTKREIRGLLDKDTKLISQEHSGKANSINAALRKAKGELIAVIDADSVIEKGALTALSETMADPSMGAATGVIKVKNSCTFFGMWLNIEQLYNSLMRGLFSKINANIVTPGPLSVYRKNALREIGGFSDQGFSEDVDIAVRLIRRGYKIGFNEMAVAFTNMPYTAKGFFMQRSRFARGWLNIFRRHLQLNSTIVDLYSLPLALFTYIQAVIMGVITFISISQGYLMYYYSKGVYMSPDVIMYLLDWLSLIGSVKWVVGIIQGSAPFTIFTGISLLTFLLSYPLFLISILKFEKKPGLMHAIPLMFMPAYWLAVMAIYILNLPESFRKNQYNIWEKYN